MRLPQMICVPEQRQSCWDAKLAHLSATNPALKQVQGDFVLGQLISFPLEKSKYIAQVPICISAMIHTDQ